MGELHAVQVGLDEEGVSLENLRGCSGSGTGGTEGAMARYRMANV